MLCLPVRGDGDPVGMDLLRLALSLGLPMDGAKFTGDWTLDIDPTFGVPVSSLPNRASAMTLPGMVLYQDAPWMEGYRDHLPSDPHLLRHELEHVDQQSALGPAFWLAYAATGGRAFEPYDPLARWLPSNTGNYDHDFSDVWTAPPEMVGNYPLFRISRRGDETKYQFMPGYPGVNFETQIR